MLSTLSRTEPLIRGGQVNYLYALTQEEAAPVNADQYAPQKLNLQEAHRLARGNRVLVAVIDSEVDASHPDLAGAVAANYDASADDEAPHPHGTGMAGAIAARRTMLGIAPQAALLRCVHSAPGPTAWKAPRSTFSKGSIGLPLRAPASST